MLMKRMNWRECVDDERRRRRGIRECTCGIYEFAVSFSNVRTFVICLHYLR